MSAKFQEIIDLIAKDKLSDAIATYCQFFDPHICTLLKREYSSIEKNFLLGSIDTADQRKAHTTLSLRILQSLDKERKKGTSFIPTAQDKPTKTIHLVMDIADEFIRKMEHYLMDKNQIPIIDKAAQARVLSYYLLDKKLSGIQAFIESLENFNSRKIGAKSYLVEFIEEVVEQLSDLQDILNIAELSGHEISETISDCLEQSAMLRKSLVGAFNGDIDVEMDIAQTTIGFFRLREQVEEKKRQASSYKFSDS